MSEKVYDQREELFKYKDGMIAPLGTVPGYVPPQYSIGLLGATGVNYGEMEANRLLVIERRILGIEASLRAAGIPVIRADDPETPA